MTPQITIYKLNKQPFRQFWPKLVEKLYSSKTKILVHCKNVHILKECDELLWTYAQLAFLPHGTCKDPYKEAQSIYITDSSNDNANNAEALIYYNMDDAVPDFASDSLPQYGKIYIVADAMCDTEPLNASMKKHSLTPKIFLQKDDLSWVTGII